MTATASQHHIRSTPVGIGLIGMGTVGTEVVRIMNEQAESLAARVGAPLELRGVVVRDTSKDRGIDPALISDDIDALVSRDDIDVIVEVMGGIDPARQALGKALAAGKSVVTANKALLAEYTEELAAASDESGSDLYFEAAVAGAIPVIGPLRRSLAGDQIQRVMGIMNGTTNFILSEMDSTGADYEGTLAEAGRLGYAEADPTADVEGFDAAAKAAIVASIAFHTRVTAADVYREGMSSITSEDFAAAKELGCTIKLLSFCEKLVDQQGNESVSARVYPALVPTTHPLANVNGAFNAVFVEAEAAGQLMFYGQGAGGAPTASAVLGDLVAASRNKVHGGRAPGESTYAALPIAPVDQVSTRYYVSMDVSERAGVLAQVASEFTNNGVSISDVRQIGGHDQAKLSVVTHTASEKDLSDTVEALKKLDSVSAVTSVLRLEGVDSE